MTFFSEVGVVMTERAYNKLLHEISAITDTILQSKLDELLSKADFYRTTQDNIIFIYWECVYWQHQGDLAMEEVIWFQDFLEHLNERDYRFLRVEGESIRYFTGRLPSSFDPYPIVIIGKRLENCEAMQYQPATQLLDRPA